MNAKRKEDFEDSEYQELPSKGLKIKLDAANISLLTNRGMNFAARIQKPFLFLPTSFTSTIPGLKPKTITRETQLSQLQEFLNDPFAPKTYCLVSAPNDGMAKLLAAYMMQHAMLSSKSSLPVWHDLTQSFKNSLIDDNIHANLLVLNNVGSTSTPAKLEKLRDLLTHYADIPRIVVATGCDPFMFFTQHLFMSLNACAYMTTNQVKKSYEL